MSDNSMKAKIKALLAKAAGTDNQAEAEIFFAKARELMDKHQIDALDLESEDPMGNEFTTKRNGGATPDWDFRLMRGCALYYGCESIRWAKLENGKKFWYQRLVGRESARLTAVAMHEYLIGVVRKLGREHAKAMGCNVDQASRRIGTMLNERLQTLAAPAPKAETAAGKNALVTLNALTLYMDDEFPDLRTVKKANTIRTRSAQKIAAGIGINVQAGHSSSLRLK